MTIAETISTIAEATSTIAEAGQDIVTESSADFDHRIRKVDNKTLTDHPAEARQVSQVTFVLIVVNLEVTKANKIVQHMARIVLNVDDRIISHHVVSQVDSYHLRTEAEIVTVIQEAGTEIRIDMLEQLTVMMKMTIIIMRAKHSICQIQTTQLIHHLCIMLGKLC